MLFMIVVALLLAAAQPPLPAHAHHMRPVEHAWRAATPNARLRSGARLRALREAVRSLDPGDADRAGPSGL
jgi:hypothetical protein